MYLKSVLHFSCTTLFLVQIIILFVHFYREIVFFEQQFVLSRFVMSLNVDLSPLLRETLMSQLH